MKKVLIFIGVIAAACLVAMAQTNSVGPQIAAFINNGGVWNPATTTSTNFPIDNAPAMEMYCFNTTTHKWVPADSNCFGGSTSFNPASPGPIGGTTPGAGAFTTLSATGQTTVASISGAPSLAAASDSTTGLSINGAIEAFLFSGHPNVGWEPNLQAMSSAMTLYWASGTDVTANAQDTGESRDAAGVIDFGNGTFKDKTATLNAGHQTLGGLAVPAAATGSPTAGQAVCWKTVGTTSTLGQCTSVVGAGGACTCS